MEDASIRCIPHAITDRRPGLAAAAGENSKKYAETAGPGSKTALIDIGEPIQLMSIKRNKSQA